MTDNSARLLQNYEATNFDWACSDNGQVATLTLNRPETKNALTLATIAELTGLFRALADAQDVRTLIIRGAGGTFCSGGDIVDIVGPLTKMSTPERLRFTRQTGELIVAMRRAPQQIIAAVDGVCAGGGAVIALAADFRLATPSARVAFLFARIGLSGADMGATGLLPRIIGQGRATELLMTGRMMDAEEGYRWGFFNSLHSPEQIDQQAVKLAESLASGPWFAHQMTKTLINKEWNMGLEDMVESEAQAQALCMSSEDFPSAYEAFMQKSKPVFTGR